VQLLNAGVFRRLKVCWGRLWSTPWVRLIVFTFIVIRVGLLLFAPLARMLYPGAFDPHPVIRPYLGVAPVTNLWLEPWQRWDTLHFQVIAERGYGAYDTSLFFLAAYFESLFLLTTVAALYYARQRRGWRQAHGPSSPLRPTYRVRSFLSCWFSRPGAPGVVPNFRLSKL